MSDDGQEGGNERTSLIKTPFPSDETRNQLIQNGFGETVRKVEAYHQVDTEEMKRIAREVYGTTGGLGDAFIDSVKRRSNNEGSDPLTTDSSDGVRRPRVLDIDNSSAPIHALARTAFEAMDGTLDDFWEGPAYDAFESYYRQLRDVTMTEAWRLAFIGDELLLMADRIKYQQVETEDVIREAISLGLLGAGMLTTSGWSLLMSVASALNMGASKTDAEMDSRSARIKAYSAAAVELHGPRIIAVDPSTLMLEFPDDPEDLADWKVRS